MTPLSQFLRNTELLASLSEDCIAQRLIPQGHYQEFQKGQFLIVPQQKVDHIGIVLSGKVHILHIFADGGQSLMSHVTQGEITGLDLVCTPSQISPYHAMAATATAVFFLPIRVLTQPGVLEDAARLQCLSTMLSLISNENMKKEYRLAILSQKGLRERIITYLTMQANRRRRGSFSVSFSRDEMASFLCVNRSALSHELSLMEQEGILSFRKNHFTLHNWDLDFPD